MSRWRSEDDAAGSTSRLSAAVRESGVVTEQQLRDAMSRPRGAFLLLRAVDQAFATIDPYTGINAHGRLGRCAHHFARYGRFNPDARLGHVLPRRAYPGRPQPVPDRVAGHLQSLMYVEEMPARHQIKTIKSLYDFDPKIRQAREILVGCVPFLDQLDELQITRTGDSYSAHPRTDDPSCRDQLQKRCEEALHNLDRSGAHIGVLPELALNDVMLDWWQRTLRRTPRPAGSPLEWILVGTGPLRQDRRGRPADDDPPPNRAVLLSRVFGRTIMWQDKCEPFSLDDDMIRKWDLGEYLGEGPLTEWKQDNDERYLLDTRIGRIAVMVCEDLTRSLTLGADLAKLEPTHLFAPIFAPPILRYHWQEQAAMQYANTVGAATVIANSQAVRVDPDGQPGGTAMAVKPEGQGPSMVWALDTRLADTAGDPAGVATFTLPRA